MFEYTDKKKIYWLIDQYLSQNIEALDFCSEYHLCYDVGIDLSALNKKEKTAFAELSMVAGRFSNFEDDHKQYPGVYYTLEELDQKIVETKETLKNDWTSVRIEDLIKIIKEVERNSNADTNYYTSQSLCDEEECKRIKNIITPQLGLIEEEVYYLLCIAIKNSKTLEEAQEYFDVLQKIEEVVAGLFYRKEVEVSAKMEQFIRECDRLDDPWQRQHIFEKIKQENAFSEKL